MRFLVAIGDGQAQLEISALATTSTLRSAENVRYALFTAHVRNQGDRTVIESCCNRPSNSHEDSVEGGLKR